MSRLIKILLSYSTALLNNIIVAASAQQILLDPRPFIPSLPRLTILSSHLLEEQSWKDHRLVFHSILTGNFSPH